MARGDHQQFDTILKEKNNILICLPQNPTTDAIASGLALFTLLAKEGKKAKVVSAGFNLPANHTFIPNSGQIETTLDTLRKFIIAVDISKTKIHDLSYDIQGANLNIFLSPEKGILEPSNIKLIQGEFAFDLIIILDSPELERLGKLHQDNAEFFYHTPIVNIDHHPTNEHYGQINILDINATSISEMLFTLLEEYIGRHLDEYIATQLLTGIISKTKSFQSGSVTPKSLSIASHLIQSGARRDEIVKHLYQTKSLNLLKLWGRTLARLKVDKQFHIVSSMLNNDDFAKSQANEEDLAGVVDELIVNTPDADCVVITYEIGGTTHALCITPRYINGLEVFKDWLPTGTGDFTTLTLKNIKTLPEAENAIITVLKEQLRKV